MIVDDSLEHRSKFRRLIEDLGNEVVEAASGMEALHLYTSVQPDVVALVHIMPKLGGISTLQRLRVVDPKAKVVIVSTSTTVNEMLAAREAGASGFLLKPLRREKVEEVIKRISGEVLK